MSYLKKAASHYFSRQSLPYWTILLVDCMIILFAELAVFAVFNGIHTTIDNISKVVTTLLVYSIPYVVGFRLFHTYSGVIRFSSFVDLRRVGMAMLFGAAVDLLAQWIFKLDNWLWDIRIANVILWSLFATAMMWTIRIWVKTLYDATSRDHRNVRVFIYGVRAGGVALAKSINTQDDSPYVISGFFPMAQT